MRRVVARTSRSQIRQPKPRPPRHEEQYARNDAQAIERASKWRERDPYEGEIEPSLLSSNEIAKYVRDTAMLFPFNEDDLKTASYAVKFGSFSYEFDDNGGYQTTKLTDLTDGLLRLPANSIVFVQCATHFRLPKYMALRFNLRIKHVHRGLLLGTGPLVDPGFDGELLIPLHNLTSKDHYVDVHSHVIWVEFTKTTYKRTVSKSKDLAVFDDRKKNIGPTDYLDDARKSMLDGKYLPIQSSINGVMKDSISVARESVKISKRTERRLFSFGIISAIGVAVAVTGLAISVNIFLGQFVQATYEQVDEARQNIGTFVNSQSDRLSQVVAGIDSIENERDAISGELEALRSENAILRSEISRLSLEFRTISSQFDLGPADPVAE